MTKVFALILLILFGLSVAAFSQSNASAIATATIVEPVGISQSVDSDYGNVAVILAGTVFMTPVGVTPKKGNIMLPVSSGTYTAASFYLSGTAGYTYTISVPSKPVTIHRGTEFLKVDTFSSDNALNAGDGLTAGVYVSITPFNVMVNYN
jgi:hypothetical protein